MSIQKPYEYVYSGTLDLDSLTYTKRKADTELYEGLKNGNFCYVFNSRKTGKSSLRVQTMRRLQNDGIACAEIDLSADGSNNVTQEQWYAGIIDTLINKFNLDFDLESWWEEQELLSPIKRFGKFIETVLLVQILQNNPDKKIVLFIDEIDSVLSLNFPTDDFFTLIRACYNQRADNPKYKHLTFCMLGTITPSDLIADKTRTPFNIGQAIELTGFTFEEAKPTLTPGLASKVDNPELILQEVLNWTGGQPFLTQKLCNFIVQSSTAPLPNRETEWVEEIVRSRIITNWESQDVPEHLQTIINRIFLNKQRINRLLGIYQRILLSTSIDASNEHQAVVVDESSEQVTLRLSGLVVKNNGVLKVYNRIYQSVFDWNWVEKELVKLRPYGDSLTAWFDSQDESQLLRGQALRDAQTWRTGKSLSDRDYHFLAASEALEKRQIEQANEILVAAQQRTEIALEEEKKANQRLVEVQQKAEVTLEKEKKANQRLVEAQRKTEIALEQKQRAQKIGTAVLVLSILGAIIATAVAGRANLQLVDAKREQKQAEDKRKDAETQAQGIKNELNQKNQDLGTATQEVDRKKQELQRANQQLKVAAQKEKFSLAAVANAKGEQKQAQQQAQQAQQQRQQAETARQTALQELAQAEEKQKQAQQKVQKAESELKLAESDRDGALVAKEQAQRELSVVQLARSQAEQERQIAQKVTKLEQDGINALREFSSGNEIDGLLSALKAGRELKSLVKQKKSLVDYPAYSPVFSLQAILLDIREKNRLEGHQSFVFRVVYSPDGKTLASASWDNTIKLWNLDLDNLLAQGCNWLEGYLATRPDVAKELCPSLKE
jgi:hypothetical protein